MRIDLENGGRRPLPMKVLLGLAKGAIGMQPGPQLVMSYRPDLLGGAFRRHFLRAGQPTETWSSGDLELMGTLVSALNECEF